MSAGRRVGFFGAAVLLSLLAGFGVGELAMRGVDPPPRVQIIRPWAVGAMREVRGVPVYEVGPEYAPLRAEGCEAEKGPEARSIVLVGDSIVFSGPERNVATFLTRELEARGGRWCVHNLAQPGFIADQKRALVEEAVLARPPELVLWQLWADQGQSTRVGGSLYMVPSHVLDASGTPVLPGVPVPDALNRLLFRSSRLWEHTVLAFGSVPETLPRHGLQHVEAATRTALGVGADVIWLDFPALSQPFADSAAEVSATRDEREAVAAALGVPIVGVAAALDARGQDHLALRRDPCCHYNPEGEAQVAAVLADVVSAWDRRSTP